LAFIVLRLLYIAAYSINFDLARTVFWGGGAGVCVAHHQRYTAKSGQPLSLTGS
jgi:hypothetical protein